MSGRPALIFCLGVAAAALSAQAQTGEQYYLSLRVHELTANLMNNQPRAVYRMFVPTFQQDVSFARFESSFVRWQSGRRMAKARSRVVDVRGLGGHASTYVVFEGEDDYEYIYSGWLSSDGRWQIAWLSNILDRSFNYGAADSALLHGAAEAALRFALSDSAPRTLRGQLPKTETCAVLSGDFRLPVDRIGTRPVIWVTVPEIQAGTAPPVPYFCQIQLVRVFGDLAQATIDFLPGHADTPHRLARRRGIVVYLEREGAGWRFHSVGRLY